MKRWLIALVFVTLSLPCLAQNADDPASRDDVILLLRTMHSHDLIQKTTAAQLVGMRQLLHDQVVKEKGTVPPDFEVHFTKVMDDMIKGMPIDEITQAMIPSYEKHFTHGDIEAMNGFYSSPVGQKVLEQLPAVMQEGMQEAMPILSRYLSEWQKRMKNELEPAKTSSPAKTTDDSTTPK